MPSYRDPRDDRWHYRVRVTFPIGKRKRIGGTAATNTQKAADHAERLHVLRVTAPEALADTPATIAASEPKEVTTKTIPLGPAKGPLGR